MKAVKLALLFGAFLAALLISPEAADAAKRVLIVGDETVVDGAAESYGFVNALRKALDGAEEDYEIVPLGVRRSTFEDWRALVAKSRDENPPLDVEGVSLKDEFDKGADVVFIVLGLNDARKPTFKISPVAASGAVSNPFGSSSVFRKTLGSAVIELVGAVKDRAPDVGRVVLVGPYPGASGSLFSGNVYELNSTLADVARALSCQNVNLGDLFRYAQRAGKMASEPIAVVKNDYRPNEYGSQLMTWAFLLALSDKGFNRSYDEAVKKYAGSPEMLANPEGQKRLETTRDSDEGLDETEKIARKYYLNAVDERLRDFVSPGFCLSGYARVVSVVPPALIGGAPLAPKTDSEQDAKPSGKDVVATVVLETRAIEADQPIDENLVRAALVVASAFAPVSKTPKFEIVSSGNLQYEGPNLHDSRADRRENNGRYSLTFKGTVADLPADVVVRIGDVEKKVRVAQRNGFYFSSIFPLEQPFASLDDFPQAKATTTVDYAVMSHEDPLEFARSPFARNLLVKRSVEVKLGAAASHVPKSLNWLPSSYADVPQYATDGDEEIDPDFVDVARFCQNQAYAGVYVVRYVDVPSAQSATLKLGVKGYKTHVVERVYLNGKQVFFGELDVDAPEKNEASVPVVLKEGRNVLVARVDHTIWDWIVGFKFVAEDGKAL